MASDLIKKLQEQVDKHGDIPVALSGEQGYMSAAFPMVEPYYYDGGYCARDTDDPSNWISSRARDPKSGWTTRAPGFPDLFIKLVTAYPCDEEEKINGRPLREIDPEEWAWWDEKELEERNLFGGELVKYKVAKERDPKLDCYPYSAYLASMGLEAVGNGTMASAKEALLKKFREL